MSRPLRPNLFAGMYIGGIRVRRANIHLPPRHLLPLSQTIFGSLFLFSFSKKSKKLFLLQIK